MKKVAQLAANVRALAAQRNFHSDKHPYLRFPGGIGGGAATVDSNETTCHQIKPRFVFQQSLISPSFQFFPSFLDKKLSILSIFRSRNETATRKKRKRIAPVGRGGKEKKKGRKRRRRKGNRGKRESVKQRCCPRCVLIFMSRKSASTRQRGARPVGNREKHRLSRCSFSLLFFVFFHFSRFPCSKLPDPLAASASRHLRKRGMNN